MDFGKRGNEQGTHPNEDSYHVFPDLPATPDADVAVVLGEETAHLLKTQANTTLYFQTLGQIKIIRTRHSRQQPFPECHDYL